MDAELLEATSAPESSSAFRSAQQAARRNWGFAVAFQVASGRPMIVVCGGMIYPQVFESVRKRPEMHLPAATYEAAVSYLLGYDAALQGGLLFGFREWLITRLEMGNNLAWPGLARELMKRRARTDDPYEAIDFLFGTVETFMRERAAANGTRQIFAAYEQWLQKQEWYDPSSPHWIPPKK